MANLWLKIKIWTKLIVVVLALTYIILFAVYNSENPASLWFFFGTRQKVETTVLKLVLIAFASGVIVTVLLRTTLRTVSQIRELKERQETEKREKDLEELKNRAGMLRPKPRVEDAPADSTPR